MFFLFIFVLFFSCEQKKITCVAAECHIKHIVILSERELLKGKTTESAAFYFFNFFSPMSTVMGKNERGVCTLLKIVPPFVIFFILFWFVFFIQRKARVLCFRFQIKRANRAVTSLPDSVTEYDTGWLFI